MDIDLYRQLFQRFWGLLLAVVVVSMGIAMALTITKAPSYQGSVYVSIAQAPQTTQAITPSYEYGEYYSLQGSNFLADYFLGWLKDPATIQDILQKAGGGLPNKSLTSISRFFNAKSLGTVGLQVFHTTSSADETQRTLEALQEVLGERLTQLQSQGFYKDFAVVPGQVVVRQQQPDVMVSSLIGLVSGLVLALFVLLVLAIAVPHRRT